jgi:hypothetical protein
MGMLLLLISLTALLLLVVVLLLLLLLLLLSEPLLSVVSMPLMMAPISSLYTTPTSPLYTSRSTLTGTAPRRTDLLLAFKMLPFKTLAFRLRSKLLSNKLMSKPALFGVAPLLDSTIIASFRRVARCSVTVTCGGVGAGYATSGEGSGDRTDPRSPFVADGSERKDSSPIDRFDRKESSRLEVKEKSSASLCSAETFSISKSPKIENPSPFLLFLLLLCCWLSDAVFSLPEGVSKRTCRRRGVVVANLGDLLNQGLYATTSIASRQFGEV